MYRNLKAEMIRSGLKTDNIANVLNTSMSNIYNRFHCQNFSVAEAIIVRDKLFPGIDIAYLFANE